MPIVTTGNKYFNNSPMDDLLLPVHRDERERSKPSHEQNNDEYHKLTAHQSRKT
jgi:hypothetical protein